MIWSIYVSNIAVKNFSIGLQQKVWGAREDAFKAAAVGDYVVFVVALTWTGDEPRPRGYPRLKASDLDNFKGLTKRVIITKITHLFIDPQKEIWPDDRYPYRFNFNVIKELETNLEFGLDYCNDSFVASVRQSLLSKGSIAKVAIKSINELYKNNQQSSKFNLTTSLTIRSKNEISPSLGVREISETLASIIINQPDDSGMMVGIFGKWGRGKTYLAEQTWESIKQNKPEFQRVVFSAWKYQDTKSSWAYLYKSLLDEYLFESEPVGLLDKIKNSYKRIIKVFNLNRVKHSVVPALSLFASAIWLFLVDGKLDIYAEVISFLGVVTVLQITYFYFRYSGTIANLFNNYFSQKNFSDYLGLQAEVEDSITSLLKVWIKQSDRNKKVVLFVDDVDRCNIEQILSIIDGLRVILDNSEINQRLVIITAVDERMLQRSLKYKYEKFDDKIIIKDIFKEYLEKIFIVGLKLNPLNRNEIKDFLNNIIPELASNLENTPDIEVHEDDEGNHEYTDENQDNTKLVPEIKDDSDLDISPDEREYLLSQASELENATPRKIRIFYYKYLILKKLLIIKLEKDSLLSEWANIKDEHIIIDALIYSTNGGLIDDYFLGVDDTIINYEINETIKYVVLMVSVL